MALIIIMPRREACTGLRLVHSTRIELTHNESTKSRDAFVGRARPGPDLWGRGEANWAVAQGPPQVRGLGWRRGVVVSGVRRMNESSNNRLVLGQKPEVLSQRRLGGKFKN